MASSFIGDWPSINMDLLPPEEQLTAWRLSTFGLRGLLVYCRGFQVALSLFDFSSAQVELMKGQDPAALSLPLREWQFLCWSGRSDNHLSVRQSDGLD
jgi:hypothetical protein